MALQVTSQPQYQGKLKVTTAQPAPLKVQPVAPQPIITIAKPQVQPKISVAPVKQQGSLPVTVNLPNGKSATFPNAQAAAAFKAAIGLNDTPNANYTPQVSRETNIAQDVAQGFAKPLVWAGDRLGRLAAYGIGAVTGNEQMKENALNMPNNVALPGIGTIQQTAPQSVKQEVGNAIQLPALAMGPAAGGFTYGLGEGLAKGDSVGSSVLRGGAYALGGKVLGAGVSRIAAPILSKVASKFAPAAEKVASVIPQGVKQQASNIVSKVNQTGDKIVAPYNRVIENTPLMKKANSAFVQSVTQNIKALADLPDRALQNVSRKLEQSSLRMTPTEKRNLGAKLKEVTDFLAEKKLVGTPQMRYDKVTGLYQDSETTLQSFLSMDAKDRVVNKQTLLDTIENLKANFQSHRDVLAIEGQLDDFKKLIESKYPDGIPLARLNQLKRSTFENAFNKAGNKVLDDVEFSIGDALKQSIEDATKGLKINGKTIAEFNKEYGKIINARKLLNVAKDRNQVGAIGRLILAGFGGASLFPATGGIGSAAGAYFAQAGANEIATPIRSALGASVRQLAKKNPAKFTGIKAPEVNVGLSIKNVGKPTRYTVKYTENGKKRVLKDMDRNLAMGWTKRLEEQGIKYEVVKK